MRRRGLSLLPIHKGLPDQLTYCRYQSLHFICRY